MGILQQRLITPNKCTYVSTHLPSFQMGNPPHHQLTGCLPIVYTIESDNRPLIGRGTTHHCLYSVNVASCLCQLGSSELEFTDFRRSLIENDNDSHLATSPSGWRYGQLYPPISTSPIPSNYYAQIGCWFSVRSLEFAARFTLLHR